MNVSDLELHVRRPLLDGLSLPEGLTVEDLDRGMLPKILEFDSVPSSLDPLCKALLGQAGYTLGYVTLVSSPAVGISAVYSVKGPTNNLLIQDSLEQPMLSTELFVGGGRVESPNLYRSIDLSLIAAINKMKLPYGITFDDVFCGGMASVLRKGAMPRKMYGLIASALNGRDGFSINIKPPTYSRLEYAIRYSEKEALDIFDYRESVDVLIYSDGGKLTSFYREVVS